MIRPLSVDLAVRDGAVYLASLYSMLVSTILLLSSPRAPRAHPLPLPPLCGSDTATPSRAFLTRESRQRPRPHRRRCRSLRFASLPRPSGSHLLRRASPPCAPSQPPLCSGRAYPSGPFRAFRWCISLQVYLLFQRGFPRNHVQKPPDRPVCYPPPSISASIDHLAPRKPYDEATTQPCMVHQYPSLCPTESTDGTPTLHRLYQNLIYRRKTLSVPESIFEAAWRGNEQPGAHRHRMTGCPT